jgi:hypothetical protein
MSAKIVGIKAPTSVAIKNKLKTGSVTSFSYWPMHFFTFLALGIVAMRQVSGTAILKPGEDINVCNCCGIDDCGAAITCWGTDCPPGSSLLMFDTEISLL